MVTEDWEWAWLAGLFEGEGTITFTNVHSAMVRIAMTDKDVIETLDHLFPSPNGIRSYHFANKLEQWVWQIAERDTVREFLAGVMPYLHSRRKAKADETFVRLLGNRGNRGRLTHCKRGHKFDEQNTRITPNGTRHCRACARLHDQKRYDRIRKKPKV